MSEISKQDRRRRTVEAARVSALVQRSKLDFETVLNCNHSCSLSFDFLNYVLMWLSHPNKLNHVICHMATSSFRSTTSLEKHQCQRLWKIQISRSLYPYSYKKTSNWRFWKTVNLVYYTWNSWTRPILKVNNLGNNTISSFFLNDTNGIKRILWYK